MSSVFADVLSQKDFEVTFVVKVSARNAGEAIHRAADRLMDDTTVALRDVKEVTY